MARGVRARITWLATSVTLGVSVLVCVGVYAGLHVGLYREVDGFLDGEVQEFHAILTNEWNDDLGEIEREIRAEIGSRSNTDLVFRLLDSDGKLLITSDPDDRFANPWRVPTELRAVGAGAWRESIDPPLSAAPYRLCARIERLPNRGDMIIQAAYRVDHVRRSLALCRVFCLGAVAVAAGLAFMGGRAVARSSMAPVVSIMNAARQIGAERLSARVPRLATRDELDALAETLNAMLDRVERSFRQIQQFTADAAHELRTPLTALRGTAEQALARPRTAEQLRSVIESSLEYYRVLGRVTDDLLLLARLDAGQEPLRSEQFSLQRIVDDVVDLYRPLAEEQGIALTVQKRDDAHIHADKGKIRRLLNNLVDNAVKYMNGKGTVSVRVERANGMLLTSITDTGPGIPAADLPHIFERFYRVDRARAVSADRDSRSVGLGLAICQSIVQAHGGNVSIKSAPERGTEVLFTLPINGSANRIAES